MARMVLFQVWTLFVVSVQLLSNRAFGQNIETDVFSRPFRCNSDTECVSIHLGAVCVPYDTPSVSSMGSGAGNDTSLGLNETSVSLDDGSGLAVEPSSGESESIMKKCRCNSDLGFHKRGNTCVKRVGVGGECSKDGTAVCIDPNSKCRDDGSNIRRYRCLCKTGFIQVYYNGTDRCGAIITSADDESCQTCESNEGTCFSVSGDRLQDGCLCPSTRSGDDCGSLHVVVKCDMDAFKMIVCYEEHLHIDFSTGVGLYVIGREGDEMCKGKQTPINDTDCPDSSFKLVLDLKEPGRSRCGVREITRIPNQRSFETQLNVAPIGPVIDVSNSVTFNAFCKVTTNVEASFQGLEVNGVPGNNRGQHRQPNLSLDVLNALGLPLPERALVRLGDKIQFKIQVEEDGIYGSLKVEQCTASSSADIPDPKAVVLPLTISGCPAFGQTFIDNKNNWQRIGTSVSQVQTGLVPMFKLRKGKSVFMHCSVKLCLVGNEEDCSPELCPNAPGVGNLQRKRRATSAEEIGIVSRELFWVNGSQAEELAEKISEEDRNSVQGGAVILNATSFALLILFGIILLILVVISAVFLVYKLRNGSRSTSTDNLVGKPQRFALPRITRNTFRI